MVFILKKIIPVTVWSTTWKPTTYSEKTNPSDPPRKIFPSSKVEKEQMEQGPDRDLPWFQAMKANLEERILEVNYTDP